MFDTELQAKNLSWIAGVLEGEACFRTHSYRKGLAGIDFTSCDKDTVEVVKLFLGAKNIYSKKPKKANWNIVYRIQRTSLDNKDRLEAIYPYMSLRRQAKIASVLGYVPDNEFLPLDEEAWLAGILEAEGSFLKPSPSSPASQKIQMASTDEDVIQHVARLFDVAYHEGVKPKRFNHKQSWQVMCRGTRAIRWMKRLLPYMSERRSEQIDVALASRNSQILADEIVLEVRRRIALGERNVDIAKDMDLHYDRVRDIKSGKTYKDV